MAALTLFLLGMEMVNPLGTTIARHPFGRQAGAASALIEFLQMGCAAIAISIGAMLPRAHRSASSSNPASHWPSPFFWPCGKPNRYRAKPAILKTTGGHKNLAHDSGTFLPPAARTADTCAPLGSIKNLSRVVLEVSETVLGVFDAHRVGIRLSPPRSRSSGSWKIELQGARHGRRSKFRPPRTSRPGKPATTRSRPPHGRACRSL